MQSHLRNQGMCKYVHLQTCILTKPKDSGPFSWRECAWVAALLSKASQQFTSQITTILFLQRPTWPRDKAQCGFTACFVPTDSCNVKLLQKINTHSAERKTPTVVWEKGSGVWRNEWGGLKRNATESCTFRELAVQNPVEWANPSPRKPVYRIYPSPYSSPSFLFYNKNLSTWRSMIVIFHVPQSPFLVYMITCFLQQQEQEQQQHCLPEKKKQIIKTDYENLSSRLRWIPNL